MLMSIVILFRVWLASVAHRLLVTRLSLLDNWSTKAKRRRTTGTGRLSHLKTIHRRFKNGFRQGTKPAPKKVGAAAK